MSLTNNNPQQTAFSFLEPTDVRDGLTPSLRKAFSILQTCLPKNHYGKSLTAVQTIAEYTGCDDELIYDALVDSTYPRCAFPLIDGHGNFGFPPAIPYHTELKLSQTFINITDNKQITDIYRPLIFPIPYALVSGTFGYGNCTTKIPSHNLGEVLDATVALIQNPDIETEELLQFIKGPDLLLGGTIENPKDLCDIYKTGSGIIKVSVSKHTLNSWHVYDAEDYCNWYGLKSRKRLFKNDCIISVRYHAFLSDGTQTKLMSLKEILQKYLDYYKSSVTFENDEALCRKLTHLKELSPSRITIAKANSV